MIIAILVVLGLCLGSFVNALVYRLHEQSKKSGKSKKLSVINGRSICVHCGHVLSWKDLIPVISWLSLKGRCRYCGKPVSWRYPAVELAVAGLFIVSYLFWPGSEAPLASLDSAVNFIAWLAILTGFTALFIYDLNWMLLPNRIIYPLMALAAVLAVLNIFWADNAVQASYDTLMGILIAGGVFYLLFQVSNGRWIGGGDVKLGLTIGLVLADPFKAFLMLMAASTLGTLVVLPGLVLKKLKTTSRIPFGPFLLAGAVFAMLFGQSLIDWYKGLIGF